jgi:hypothetical protein
MHDKIYFPLLGWIDMWEYPQLSGHPHEIKSEEKAKMTQNEKMSEEILDTMNKMKELNYDAHLEIYKDCIRIQKQTINHLNSLIDKQQAMMELYVNDISSSNERIAYLLSKMNELQHKIDYGV